jgi:mycoredoxin
VKLAAAIIAALVLWGACAQLERSRINRQIIAEANGSSEVILYATDWCGYCRATRKFLDDKGIAFTEYDIEKSEEGARQYKALGVRGVPILKVKGKVVEGFDPDGILAALK